MENKILRKKASKLIAETLMKSMVREISSETKVTIKKAKTTNNMKSQSTKRKLNTKQIQNLTNTLLYKAFKNELKFISYKLYKTYIETPNDYEKIKRLETNVNITLDLMQKEKIEIASYKDVKGLKTIEIHKYNNYEIKKPVTLKGNYKALKKQYKNQLISKVKQIEYFREKGKKGFEIVDNIELEDLRANTCLFLLEYLHKYNNEIINYIGYIPFTIANKIVHKVQYQIQRIKSYSNLKMTNTEKINYLIDKKSFEIYQSPIGETLQKAKQIEKRKDNAIDYILQTLTKQQFEIYQLKLSGYSFQDIALKLDKTRGTISKIYYRVIGYMQKDKKLETIMNSVIA